LPPFYAVLVDAALSVGADLGGSPIGVAPKGRVPLQ